MNAEKQSVAKRSREYNFKEIEAKWQAQWDKEGYGSSTDFSDKPKFYSLVEFPYPSGEGLHVGHCMMLGAADAHARMKRMQGFNVLYPMGWDAFGLPTENYAIRNKIQPAVATAKNVANFKRQQKSLGYSFDWPREINTTDPEYYKWTQWIFLQFYHHAVVDGKLVRLPDNDKTTPRMAFQTEMPVNWCPSCKIILANEEVISGNCERCGAQTEKRKQKQWMLRITAYADRLIKDLNQVEYLDKIKTQQVNWIGRSEGVRFFEKVKDLDIKFEVYDSIPQTFLAQTFTVIAPEHPMVYELVKGTSKEKEVMDFVKRIEAKKIADKFDVDKDSEGIFTGRYVDDPFGTGDLPIWVASYVLADYGTGIVNCSAHDERDFLFAKKYDIPLKVALLPKDSELANKVTSLEVFYREPDGIVQSPEKFKGMRWDESRQKIIDYVVENKLGVRSVQYKLRDWIFSRQHYWGEPIPIIHCDKCGKVPVPEDQLPVTLPEVENYAPTDTGESPLAAISDWVETKCPNCGGPAKRETDTMPNWAGSSWYFLRYCDPKNNKALADQRKLQYWMPVDLYNGGMEHTTLHLLYSRFWHKFLFDLGVVPSSEPYAKRIAHGIILGPDGQKMSKSRGNVINPDGIVEKLGADTLRTYIMFIGPYDQDSAWNPSAVLGVHRFLQRVYAKNIEFVQSDSIQLLVKLNQTIQGVTADYEEFKLNTVVSKLMELYNEIEKSAQLTPESYAKFLILLFPAAPHIACELWEEAEFSGSLYDQPWPKADIRHLEAEKIEIAIQINGKVRQRLEVENDISDADLKSLALESDAVKKYTEGKTILKVIIIPKKLISIAVKE